MDLEMTVASKEVNRWVRNKKPLELKEFEKAPQALQQTPNQSGNPFYNFPQQQTLSSPLREISFDSSDAFEDIIASHEFQNSQPLRQQFDGFPSNALQQTNLRSSPQKRDFEPSIAKAEDIMLNGAGEEVENLIQNLKEVIKFNDQIIRCTSSSKKEFEEMIKNSAFKEVFQRAIDICKAGIKILCKSEHPLRFYIAKESFIDGYANQNKDINFNLGWILHYLSSGEILT